MPPEKPWQPILLMRLLVGLFASLFVCSLVASSALPKLGVGQSNRTFWTFVISSIGFHWAMLGLTWKLLRDHEMTWREAFGIRWDNLSETLGVAFCWLLMLLPVCIGINMLSALVMQSLHHEVVAQPAIQALQDTSNKGQQIYFGFMAVVLAPVAEEIFFRGILFSVLEYFGFPRLALWGTSILFGLIHGAEVTLIPLTVFALLLALLYRKTGNLLTTIFVHAGFNLINFLVLIAMPELLEKYHLNP